MVSGVTDISTDSGYSRARDPDMLLGSSSGPDDTMAAADSTGHSDQCDPGSGMALRHQHDNRLWPGPGHLCGLWWHHGPRTSPQTLPEVGPWIQMSSSLAAQAWMLSWPQVAEQATQMDMAPETAWLMDTNMVPDGGLHSWCRHGLRWLPGAADINTDPCCDRATDPDMLLSSNPGPAVILVPGGNQAANISPFLSPYFFRMLLTTVCEASHLSSSPLSLPYHNGTLLPSAARHPKGLWMLPSGQLPHGCLSHT